MRKIDDELERKEELAHEEIFNQKNPPAEMLFASKVV